jgi:hypothetical protein
MCTLYFQTKSQDRMRHAFGDMCADDEDRGDLAGNLTPMARTIMLLPQARGWNGRRDASWPAPTGARNWYVQGALA